MQQLLGPENNIVVHQAYYGEVNRSHGCIISSLKDDHLKSALTAFTDRPGTIPAGLKSVPYYSGASFDEYYAFTLTFPDTEASRGGMVFTHVLLVKMKDIGDVNALENLFRYFVAEIPDNKAELLDKKAEIPDLVLNRELLKARTTSSSFPVYIQQTVGKLVSAELPVVFCGSQEAFKTVMASIWRGLPVTFRKKIAYTAGFSSTNIDTTKTIVHFQKSLETILSNVPHVTDASEEEVEIVDPVEKYLLQSDSNNAFETFLKNLKVNITDWNTLKTCVSAFQSYLKINQQIDVGELKLLIRYLAKIAPAPKDGSEIKDEVLTLLCSYLLNRKEENIKSLRNLPLEAFENGARKVSLLIEETVTKEFETENFMTAQLSELIQNATIANQFAWWSDAIKSALKNACSENQSIVVKNIWKLLLYTLDLQAFILENIPNSGKAEEILIENLPANVPSVTAQSLVKKIRKRKWFLLHAHLLLKCEDEDIALLEQIEFEETNPVLFEEGTKLILKKIQDDDLLALVLKHPKIRLIEEYATRSMHQPTLLAKLDVTNTVWLRLWNASLEKTKNILHGIKDIKTKVYQVLDRIVNGENIPENIVLLIAESGYADISSYSRRTEVWIKLPSKVKHYFLSATANSYLENLSQTDADTVLEPELNSHISDDGFMTTFLRNNQGNIGIVISAYEYVTGLKDNFLADYIRFYSGSITTIDESRLGSVILSKQFSLSARSVFEKVKGNGSFKTTLAVCNALVKLNLWESFFSGHLLGQNISPNLIYDGLLDLAISLYPQGPEDKDVWKKAGGEVSKLHNLKTREENWRHAINLLKSGGGGKHISTKSLVNEMLNDFPNNSQLKEIKKHL